MTTVPHFVTGAVAIPLGWWGNQVPGHAEPLIITTGGLHQLPLFRNGTIGLVGCSKRKRHTAGLLPAAELYTGQLFRCGYRHSTAHHDLTFILSGRWGLVDPATPLADYDYVLPQQQAIARAWAIYVAGQLRAVWAALGTVRDIYLYAGARYAQPLLAVWNNPPGVACHWPVQGLTRPEQVRWFQEHGQDPSGGLLPTVGR